MTAVLTGIVVVAAAALMFVCLCVAMSREARDRACPVRPVPPRPARRRTDLDDDPIWATTPVEGGESPAEMWALRGLRARYTTAHEQLYGEAIALGLSPAASSPSLLSEVNEGGDRA